MIGTLKRTLCLTLIAAMALSSLIFPVRADGEPQYFNDVAPGTWYYEAVNAAAHRGIVGGRGNWIFDPKSNVTRAEFVKMLLNATVPYAGTQDYLSKTSSSPKSGETLSDVSGHWLSTEGSTQMALNLGLIRPDDNPDQAFLPDRPATRLEAAVMIVRALGLVYPAQQSEETLSFTDADAIPQELWGYVHEAVQAGVLEGYPDKTFRGEKNISRAEAAAMVLRALDHMETGVDKDIQVFVEEAWIQEDVDRQRVKVWLSVPAQVVDGTIYLPARDLAAAYTRLSGGHDRGFDGMDWDAERQQLSIYVRPYYMTAGAGDARYEYSPYSSVLHDELNTFPLPARMLYGELMIPVCTPEAPFSTWIWAEGQWDAGTKTLLLPLREQNVPLT